MNDDIIHDLKQFITATVSQVVSSAVTEQTADLSQRFDKLETRFDKLEVKVDKLETKIDDVDAKTDAILEAVGDRLDNHETRITKLEQTTA